jgi:aspartate aminotransferase
MNWFETVAGLPPDPVLGLSEEFSRDPRNKKLDLIVGSYRDEQLQPVIFQAVKNAEMLLLGQEKNKEYLPMRGDPSFLSRVGELAFGTESWEKHRNKIVGVQTVGGTGALRIGGEFLRPLMEGHLFIPNPSWPNHRHVLHQAGFVIKPYPYYDFKHHRLNFVKFLNFCEELPYASVLILHLSCHNPTGCDFSPDEWKTLSDVMRRKKLFPFFDCAYQGFGDGIEIDTQALNFFIEDGHQFLLAYSCSKNFSLYCERVGALFGFTSDEAISENLLSVLKMKTRAIISNPPAHGARIVSNILGNTELSREWREELKQASHRILKMRNALVQALGPSYD